MRSGLRFDLLALLWGIDIQECGRNRMTNLFEEGILWRYQIISVVGNGVHGKVHSLCKKQNWEPVHSKSYIPIKGDSHDIL